MRKTIYVPRGHEDPPRFLCRICQTGLHSPREYEQHVVACSQRHMNEILAAREEEKRRNGVSFGHPDPELEEHMRRVGERMRREGRLIVKPNERAGF